MCQKNYKEFFLYSLMIGENFSKRSIDESYFSIHENFCSGYLDNPNGSYVLLPYLGVASIKKKGYPSKLEKISAFDAAQVSFANLGKINAIEVSSFVSPKGRLAGHDFFYEDDILISNVDSVDVFSLDPLLEATSYILGTKGHEGYPIYPGSMVPCAMKGLSSVEEGCHLYSSLSISVPKYKDNDPFLLMEDVGISEGIDHDYFNRIAGASLDVAKLQGIDVEKIYVSRKDIIVGEGEIGYALVMCPYVHLPRAMMGVLKR